MRARAFVLCAGGIETARLLLANNRQHPNGIGNEHDIVGRFFQDHASARLAGSIAQILQKCNAFSTCFTNAASSTLFVSRQRRNGSENSGHWMHLRGLFSFSKMECWMV